jgi:isopenicillin-N N-acyltransferase-like protein
VRVLDAAGEPREIGRQIGAAAPALIVRAVELMCRIELPEDELERRLAGVERRLAAAFPSVLDESEGLAEGAGIATRDALVLSVCGDLTGRLPGWCTLAAMPGTSGPLLAKNLDTRPEMRELQLVERLSPAGGLAYTHLTMAGSMWTDGGLNEAGLALVNSSLQAGSANPEGVPDGILAREVLARCADVEEALALIASLEVRTNGENLVLADARGATALVSKLPAGQSVRRGGALAATNHPLDHELIGAMDAEDPIAENSRGRYERLCELTGAAEQWDLAGLERLLAAPGIAQDGDAGLHTIAALVIDPAGGRLRAASGSPALARFEEIEVRP